MFVAFVAVVKFYTVLKHYIAEHRPLAKLVALKIVVGVAFFEEVSRISELQIFTQSLLTSNSQIIFWILQDTHTIKPTATLAYADVTIGIPALVICIQNVPLAIFFNYAYTCKSYILPSKNTAAGQQRYKGGFCGWKAWLAILNPGEVFRGLMFIFKMVSLAQKEDDMALMSDSNMSKLVYYPGTQSGRNEH